MFFSCAYFPVFLTQPGGIPVKVVLIGCLLSARAHDWLGNIGFPDGDNDALCPVLCQPVCTCRFVLMLMRRCHISIQSTSNTYGPLTAWQRWAEPWFVNQQWWIASKTNLTEVTKRGWSQICYFCRTVYLNTRPWKSIPLPLSVFITQMTSICFSLAVFLWLLFFKGACACMPERMAH